MDGRSMKNTPTPQWLIDAVHGNPWKPDPDAPKPEPPRISHEAAQALLSEIVEVCRKHGLWIGHEDAYHAFLVQRASTEEWIMRAGVDE
jgi:sugar phosphate isomerase/epimerase